MVMPSFLFLFYYTTQKNKMQDKNSKKQSKKRPFFQKTPCKILPDVVQ